MNGVVSSFFYDRIGGMSVSKRLTLALALCAVTMACEVPEDPEIAPGPLPTPPPPRAFATLTVEPACVEPGQRFTVLATGLEPEADYAFIIDRLPHPALETGAMATADGDGEAELPGTIPEGSEAGTYTWTIAPNDQPDETLAAAELVVAEQCP